MSIASAFNNAVSGLTAVARGTSVVSSNLANALTPDYSRREVDLSSRIYSGNGGGVQVNGVNRIVSDTVLAELRLSNAGLGNSTVNHDFYKSLEAKIGQPQDSGSLSASMVRLETALISAENRPESDINLKAVFDAAQNLTHKLADISNTIQDSRTEADRKISSAVESLNNGLYEVSRLNRQIIVERANNRDSLSLEDARQAVINDISAIVPLREVSRENGQISLFSAGGAVLLDGKDPVKIGFEPSGRLTPDIDAASSRLGRLKIDDEVVSSVTASLYAGGLLSGLFDLRDKHAPEAQAKIDGIARELHDRFADPTIDSTITSGGSGLFTDERGSFAAEHERGLSIRLRVNPSIDETRGGELWRIRDGINATSKGDVGDGTLISGLLQAMNAAEGYASANAPDNAGSAAYLVSLVLSDISTSRLSAETQQSHEATLQTSLQDALFADGVDSDREIGMLLHLHKAYAANAKVIQVADEMLENLLRI